MPRRTETIPVKDGWVTRDAATGRIIAVGTDKGVAKASPRSGAVITDASSRRKAALKRLADR